MFESAPFEVNIRSYEELDERINALIDLNNIGFNSEFFRLMITNLANGRTGGQPKNLIIEKWVEGYGTQTHPIEITEEQLLGLFNYLIRFHRDVISHSGGNQYLYRHHGQVDFDNQFFVDHSILRTLELSEE